MNSVAIGNTVERRAWKFLVKYQVLYKPCNTAVFVGVNKYIGTSQLSAELHNLVENIWDLATSA